MKAEKYSTGVRKRQRLTGTAKRQWNNGNGMMETRYQPETKFCAKDPSCKKARSTSTYVGGTVRRNQYTVCKQVPPLPVLPSLPKN